MVKEQQVEAAVRSMLDAIGDDPEREGLRDTPQRVARMYTELFSGIGIDPGSAIDTLFSEEDHHGEVVLLRDVPFYSICEHHFLPFFGRAHMGYIPDGKIAGASKLARALEVIAKQPQLQERMTGQLADAINDVLKPDGVAVVLEAEHLCMSMRGVRKPGSSILTSATRGTFDRRGVTRGELLGLLQQEAK